MIRYEKTTVIFFYYFNTINGYETPAGINYITHMLHVVQSAKII